MQTLQAKTGREGGGSGFKLEGFGLGWQLGSYGSERVVTHGGGYPGAAAHVSFLPGQRVGVAVVANTGAAAGPFVSEVVAVDVYKRLLGAEAEDILPRLRKRYDEYRASQEKETPAPNPAEGKGLSLAPEQYAGDYENENWGTVRVGFKDGKLTAGIGDLIIEWKSTEADRLQVRGPGLERWREARFEVKDGRVLALVIPWDGKNEVRHTRGTK
jgi:hypothetical protein